MSHSILKEKANIGPCMDVKAHKGLLYAIQNSTQCPDGRLCVLSPDFTLLHTYEGIGNARQIEMAGDVAVITAREDGLWLFDVSLPTPKLLCHYQTVEFATGVALWANFAFISCRQFGVQILDISDPIHPIHIGIIRNGEIQSATVADGILYGGAWGEMKVIVVDVHDVSNPIPLSEIPLMGRGDGVHVKDGILYAATGQHARGLLNVTDRNDPAFGMGNGIETFDVHDPSHPKRLNSKFLGKGYCMSVDMWEPAIYGDTLVVNNSILGVFGLCPATFEEQFYFIPPSLSDKEDAVTGVTSLNGDLFVATAFGDLYAHRKMGLGDQAPNLTDFQMAIKPQPFTFAGEGNATLAVRYSGTFPVLEMAEAPDCLVLACCEGGVHLLDKQTFAPLFRIKTAGVAHDVKIHGNKLFVAEASAGVEIFLLEGAYATKIGQFAIDKAIYQLQLSDSRHYLSCCCSGNQLRMFDVSDQANVKELYSRKEHVGCLYGNNFATNQLKDGTMLMFWHRDGLFYTNPDKGDMEFHNIYYPKRQGGCSYCAGHGIETDGEHIIYTDGGGYVFLPIESVPEFLEDVPHYNAEKKFRGLLTLGNDLMIAANRAAGVITVLNVTELTKPRIVATLTTNASPSKAIFVEERILLPGGRGGLLELTV